MDSKVLKQKRDRSKPTASLLIDQFAKCIFVCDMLSLVGGSYFSVQSRTNPSWYTSTRSGATLVTST